VDCPSLVKIKKLATGLLLSRGYFKEGQMLNPGRVKIGMHIHAILKETVSLSILQRADIKACTFSRMDSTPSFVL